VSRDYEPVPGKWYEDLDAEETFQVVGLDPDEELVTIQWPDREVEDIDLDAWHELDLELASEPEGWVDDDDLADDEEDEEDEEDEDWDEDDDEEDWDEEEDDDLDEEDDADDGYRDRE